MTFAGTSHTALLGATTTSESGPTPQQLRSPASVTHLTHSGRTPTVGERLSTVAFPSRGTTDRCHMRLLGGGG